MSHKSTIVSVGEDYMKAWITGGKGYWGPSWRLVTTLELITFYCLRFIFCAKVHYFMQIKHETNANINKMNNDWELLHKDLSPSKEYLYIATTPDFQGSIYSIR